MNSYDRRPSTDSWSLRIMREAKTVRDLAGETIPELDEHLRWSEEAAAAAGSPDEFADQVQSQARRDAYGRTAPVSPATDKQLWLIKKLVDERGLNIADWAPTNKSNASTMIDKLMGMRVAPVIRMATEKQISYLRDLLRDRDWEGDAEVETVNELQDGEISFAAASAAIDRLMGYRRRARGQAPTHGIREGRYAYTVDGGATADHYRVTRDGRIKVWSAGGEWPYTGKGLNEALTWIKNNPREAAALFGQLTSTCGRCGRDLSDDESRALGLGPVCAGKSDW